MFSEHEPLPVELQQPTRAALDAVVRSGRLPAVLLLSGPSGVGKAALASWLVRRLWCPEASAPCETCASCRKVLTGNHPDLHRLSRGSSTEEVEPSGSGKGISVGSVRALSEALGRAPNESVGRIALIVGAEDLNEEAQNALLKLLEEPPGESRVLLVAHREAALLDTVRSRCQDIAVPRLSTTEMDVLCPEVPELARRLAAGRPGQVDVLADLDLSALIALADDALCGRCAPSALGSALDQQAARLGEGHDERDALELLLEILTARLTDLAWVAAGRLGAPALGPAPEGLPGPSTLRALGDALGEARADLSRNLPAKVALLALGREFAASGVVARGAPTH